MSDQKELTPLTVVRNFFDAFNRVDFNGLADCFADDLAAVHVENEQLGQLINTAPIPGLAAAERNFGLAKNGRRYNVIRAHELPGQPGATAEGQVFVEFQLVHKGVPSTAQVNIYTIKNGKIIAKCAYCLKPNHPAYLQVLKNLTTWDQGLTPPLEVDCKKVDAVGELQSVDDIKEVEGSMAPLLVMRNFFDAFNRMDRDGLVACFSDEPTGPGRMVALHVDDEAIGEQINTAPHPGEAAANRNYELCKDGRNKYNVVRCYELSGTGKVLVEFQMLTDGKPVTSQVGIYTIKNSRIRQKIIYVIKKSNHQIYNKPLPSFTVWKGLPMPAAAHNEPKKRIVCVNGWGCTTSDNWMATVIPILEARGANVVRFSGTPGSQSPEEAIATLAAQVGQVDQNTYFLGQSLGNQIIIRYLASLPEGSRCGGFFGVAAWIVLQTKCKEPRDAWKDEFMEKNAAALAPYLEYAQINHARLWEVCRNITCLVSEDDGFNIDDRGAENAALLEKNWGANVEVLTGRRHFIGNELQVSDRRALLRFFGLSFC
jgi:ketosteroid isomerase-like protein/pimeloyl-ACP methyl ester carboxylesterase